MEFKKTPDMAKAIPAEVQRIGRKRMWSWTE
ncbi:hypothetical protein DFO70_1036 [Cytobacillus firmus]|uniref:Uncharacterized protein n=2 Tax=Cytobacillus TaxID=2675230 RepID=A0A366K1E9_CYTFI|nr:hypothetical protein DFO70_1036 [Cytobacillus firmus]TDX43819.1 hypothetical protein DFO72_10419 [Cytobacillus oceanisediminis]